MESQQLEQLCSKFYSPNPQEQKLAHDALFSLVSTPAHVSHFLNLLAQSQDPQALLFTANALTKLFTSFWTHIEDGRKSETRTFLLQYLYRQGKKLLMTAPVTLNALVRLLARIVKLQWLENTANQNICEQVNPFLSGSTAEWVTGILIYLELTNDMTPQVGVSLSRARRSAFSFRDTALPSIFKTAIETLQHFCSGAMSLNDPAEDTRLLKTVLQLSLACLSFDFMGTFPDETNDDRAEPVMIPTSWVIVKESNLPMIYSEIYKSCFENPNELKSECARVCLQCLVQVASLRRSYFSKDEDRRNHLSSLVSVTSMIMTRGIGIDTDDNCYHEFCRLLGKLNTAVPLSELKTALIEGGADHKSDPTLSSVSMCCSTGMLSRFGRAGMASDISLIEPSNPREWSVRDKPLLDWLQQVCNFTLASLKRWTYMPNTKHYLMGFWVCLVPPLIQRSNRIPKIISESILLIFRGFVDACLQIGELTALLEIKNELEPNWFSSPAASCLLFNAQNIQGANDVEDPLLHEVFRMEQLDVVENLGKVNFVYCAAHLGQHWEKLLQISQAQALPKALIEKRYTWLIYLMGALIGGQAPSRNLLHLYAPSFGGHSASDTESTMNGDSMDVGGSDGAVTPSVATKEITSKVFSLMTSSVPSFDPNSLSEPSAVESLELAFLYFMDAFRRSQFSEHARLAENNRNDPGDEDVVTLMLQKVLFNLKTKGDYEAILSKSLSIFHSLTSSVLIFASTTRASHLLVAGRVLLKSQVIQSLLTPQGSREIAVSLHGIKCGRYRTSFYLALTRLFLLSLVDENQEVTDAGMGGSANSIPKPAEQAAFNAYLSPIAELLGTVWPAGSPNGLAANVPITSLIAPANDQQQRVTVAGLFRDLRGVCSACATPESFNLFFNWLVNRPKNWEHSRLHLMSIALSVYWADYQVSISILRFAAELTSNKAQRICFDSSSPNGIILFREVSTILNAYAPQMLSRDVSTFGDVYREKYKGLAQTILVLSNALSGSFANLGAFQAYEDTALPDTIRLGIRMCLAIPEDDLQCYVKSLKSYYVFLDLITRSHMTHLLEVDFESLTRILRSLEDGMCSFSTQVALQSCTALANIAKHLISRLEFERNANTSCPTNYPTSEEDAELWTAESLRIKRFISAHPSSISRILQLAFQLLMGGEANSTWTLSSTVLGFIILAPQDFQSIREANISRQVGDEKKAAMSRAFDCLMEGVDLNLSQQSRERFTRNLYAFQQFIRSNPQTAAS